MTVDVDDVPRLTAYLLGRMPADEQALIEEEYLSNPELLDQLRAVERDLIDQYVRGELDDIEAFEQHYVNSPQRRERVEFARGLLQRLERPSAPPLTGPQRIRKTVWRMPAFVPAAALIAIMISGVLIGLWLWDPLPSRQASPPDSPPRAGQDPPGTPVVPPSNPPTFHPWKRSQPSC